jgi:hypothetical protein
MSISIHEVSAEQLARLFHHYHQTLASSNDFGKGSESGDSWEDIPAVERHRLLAAARLTLSDLDSFDPKAQQSRRYFAKPGEAEWGC